MSHLDEGTLHALLDGELSNQEVREIQAHLGSCSACGSRLQSVKEIMAESEKLVGAIQFPGTPRRPAALDPVPATPAGDPGFADQPEFDPAASEYTEDATEAPQSRAPRAPDRRPAAQPVYDEPPPVLLVPEDSQWGERRRRVLIGMRWAALVAVAVGAGYIANEVRRNGAVPISVPSSTAAPAFDDSLGPIVSAEETSRPDSGAVVARYAESTANEGTAAQRPPRALTKSQAPSAEERRAPLARVAQAESTPRAAAVEAAPERNEAPPAPRERDESEAEPATGPDVRAEAAEALAELDRQRRLERAAAATAALDAAARRQREAQNPAATQAAPAPVAPAPRTLEQRAGIYLRIGLDEAARQLGRPVHVIEGMQQQFMGLAQGKASPGADDDRPVVRVVYQDNQGRMILLDQQRIRPGQTWGSGETRWVTGEIGLSLHGEPGPQILRNLRPRVR